jgi:hypothetical protein
MAPVRHSQSARTCRVALLANENLDLTHPVDDLPRRQYKE